MNVSELLHDAFDRIQDQAHQAVSGLSRDQLAERPAPDGNTIAWLVWHLTRVQDDHVSDVADRPQTWTAGDWARRFQLPFDDHATGYGQTSDQVAQVQADGELLLGYLDATVAATKDFLSTLNESDLDRIVDRNWNPPVTLGVRMISVVSDDLQHVGQAAYVRGLLGA